MKIITNHKPRELYYIWNFTKKEQETIKRDYDYMDSDDLESALFFRYKKSIYSLGDFLSLHNKIHCPNPPDDFIGWDGYHSFGFIGGLLLKFVADSFESVIIGWY